VQWLNKQYRQENPAHIAAAEGKKEQHQLGQQW
jgi:hypothetical protein